jgi:hypothetical protein
MRALPSRGRETHRGKVETRRPGEVRRLGEAG